MTNNKGKLIFRFRASPRSSDKPCVYDSFVVNLRNIFQNLPLIVWIYKMVMRQGIFVSKLTVNCSKIACLWLYTATTYYIVVLITGMRNTLIHCWQIISRGLRPARLLDNQITLLKGCKSLIGHDDTGLTPQTK
jgi:hypothetical protein